MAPTTLMSAFLLLKLFSLGAASAIPATEKVYPEVIPGPGLPSLASLGLTSAQLHTMPLPAYTPKIEGRSAVEQCGPTDAAYTDVNDIIACYHYLAAIGGQVLTASGGYLTVFVSTGSGGVAGDPQTEGSSSATGTDIASAVLAVINGCTRPDQSVAGEGQGDNMPASFVIDVGLSSNF